MRTATTTSFREIFIPVRSTNQSLDCTSVLLQSANMSCFISLVANSVKLCHKLKNSPDKRNLPSLVSLRLKMVNSEWRFGTAFYHAVHISRDSGPTYCWLAAPAISAWPSISSVIPSRTFLDFYAASAHRSYHTERRLLWRLWTWPTEVH